MKYPRLILYTWSLELSEVTAVIGTNSVVLRPAAAELQKLSTIQTLLPTVGAGTATYLPL